MPTRINKARRQIDASAVQGEGAWVVIRTPIFEDLENLMKSGVSVDALQQNPAIGLKMLETLVEDWNWVDDDGQLLPKPTPELIRTLPFPEITFLSKQLELMDGSAKN